MYTKTHTCDGLECIAVSANFQLLQGSPSGEVQAGILSTAFSEAELKAEEDNKRHERKMCFPESWKLVGLLLQNV